MSDLIRDVVGVWGGGGGQMAEVVYSDNGKSAIENFESLRNLPDPKTKLAVIAIMFSGERVEFPFLEIPRLIPDRTGLLLVAEVPRKSLDPLGLRAPNNAAIYNADGSLRFILQNPEGVGTMFWGYENSTSNELRVSVRDMDADHPAGDSVRSYLVDTATPNLSMQSLQMIRL